jgi:hypothetical protein
MRRFGTFERQGVQSAYLFKPAVFRRSTNIVETNNENRSINLQLGRTIFILPNFSRTEWNHQNNGSHWFATRWIDGSVDFTESLLSPLYKGTVFGASSCTEGVEPIAEVKRFLSAVWFTILTVDALLFAADCRVWSFFSRTCREPLIRNNVM